MYLKKGGLTQNQAWQIKIVHLHRKAVERKLRTQSNSMQDLSSSIPKLIYNYMTVLFVGLTTSALALMSADKLSTKITHINYKGPLIYTLNA